MTTDEYGWQDKLFKDYPHLYEKTRGFFECGEGWYEMLDALSFALTRCAPEVQAAQVKEKFGTLRFYTDDDTEVSAWLVRAFEAMSYNICEFCGKSGTQREKAGWNSTECNECWEKHK